METDYRFIAWFTCDWSRTTLPIAVILLLLSPWLLAGMGIPIWLVFLQIPIYMLHQYEEHAQSRFKHYVNRTAGQGYAAMTDRAIFWINIGGVWAINLLVLYLAAFGAIGLGLIPIYLPLINAISHVAGAIFTRQYNPGLLTSLILFLPISGYSWYAFSHLVHPGWLFHLLAFIFAIVIHALIVLHVRRRVALLRDALPA